MFDAARQFVGSPEAELHGVTDDQRKILGIFQDSTRQSAALLRTDEFLINADKSAKVMNDFFAQNGFPSMQFDQPVDGEFIAGAIMRLRMQWLQEGIEWRIISSKMLYAAFRLRSDYGVNDLKESLPVFEARQDSEGAIYTINCRNGDKVTVSMIETPAADDIWSLDQASLSVLSRQAKADPVSVDTLTMPCIDLDTGVQELPWLSGVYFLSGLDNWKLDHAKQQSRLKMNRIGAIAESAAGGVLRALSIREERHDFIDRPFIVIIQRQGHTMFTAWCDQSCWNDPGEIDFYGS